MSDSRKINFIQLSTQNLKDLGVIKDEKSSNPDQSNKKIFKLSAYDPSIFEGLEDYEGNPPPKKKQFSGKSNSVMNMKKSMSFKRVSTKEVQKKTIVKNYNSGLKEINGSSNLNRFSADRNPKIPIIRKELFKLPSTTRINRKSSLSQKIPKIIPDQSPLIELEKAEKLLKNNKFAPKSIPTIALQEATLIEEELDEMNVSSPSCSGNTTDRPVTRRNSSTDSTDNEFISLEEMCNKQYIKNDNSTLNIEKLKEELSEIKKLVTVLNEKYSNFEKLLLELDNKYGPSKIEVTSIKSTKTNDLRIKLFKGNLKENISGTPKQERAKHLFNSLKKTFTMLETPKLNKENVVDDSKSSKKQNISLKLKEQCLMLYETPKHK